MGLKEITELVKTEYVFGVLFILGLIYAGKYIREVLASQAQDNRDSEARMAEMNAAHQAEMKESHREQMSKAYEREDKLMKHQTEMTVQLKEISTTQSRFATSLDKLEQRTEDNFRALWQEVQK
ncbi:hypothetical protein [Bacillus albus]|uniref:hypothetical protein n=1 Tax=Bacillus albus TaxID=2026189 RepID=UPI001020AC52|nr:hypothetical protein [Bacillus albus]